MEKKLRKVLSWLVTICTLTDAKNGEAQTGDYHPLSHCLFWAVTSERNFVEIMSSLASRQREFVIDCKCPVNMEKSGFVLFVFHIKKPLASYSKMPLQRTSY